MQNDLRRCAREIAEIAGIDGLKGRMRNELHRRGGKGGGGFKRTKERRTTMATMSDAAGKEVALTGAWAGLALLLRLKASLILGMVRCFPTRGRRTDVCSASPPPQTVDVRATHASAATTPAMASATLLPPLCRFRPLEREVGRMEPYPAAILLFPALDSEEPRWSRKRRKFIFQRMSIFPEAGPNSNKGSKEDVYCPFVGLG